jgi:hypothetical protein
VRLTLFALLLAVSGIAAAPPIELPVAPPAPVPPAPPPGASVKLAAGQVYDVRCSVPCVVRAYPPGLVSIDAEAVPAGETLRVRDNFTDGAKSRAYKGALTVYSVRAVASGKCDLVITPLGFKAEAEIVTVSLDVVAGKGPQPPPPNPDVDPAPVPKVESFRVLMVYESAAVLPAAQFGVLYGKKVEEYLNAACTKDGERRGWRRLDKDATTDNDTETFNALWAAVKPKVTQVPAFAIEVNGTVTLEPLPKTEADALALLKKYRGDK